MICSHCQKSIPDSQAKFCPFCGTVIGPMPQSSNNTNTTVHLQPNKKLFFIVIGLILMLLLVGGVLSLLRAGKLLQKTSSPSTSLAKRENNTGSTTLNSLQKIITPTSIPTKTKYDIDTDGDSIPDFVELATGYDPNKDECLLKACEGFDPNSATAPKVNVMFILDSSGSMAQMAGSQIKMTAAKEAMKKYITQVSANTNVGLMVYGHKGSNNTSDKSLSCSSIDILYPLGPVNKDQFTKAVDSFQPTGWTPIGASLRKAKDAFVGKEKDTNIILLVSDGEETCESDPIGAAAEIKNSGMKLQVDVIGFNLGAGAKTQLQQVATITSGTFYDAQTSEEFQKVFDAAQENQKKNTQYLDCGFKAWGGQVGCLDARWKKAMNYLTDLLFSTYKSPYNGVTAGNDDNREDIRRIQKEISDYYTKYAKTAQVSFEDVSTKVLDNQKAIDEQFKNIQR